MGLNDQIQNRQSGGGGRWFVFQENIPFKHMTGDGAHVFRIQPAFDPNNADPATSCIPYIATDNKLTDWARLLYIGRFIGHGKGGFGTRQDLLSLKSFDSNASCPLFELQRAIQAMSSDWGYLMEEDREQGGERKPFSRPIEHLICNIYDLNERSKGNQIACFSKSATDALIDSDKGLAFQRVARPQAELEANYLAGYAVGDLTDPTNGPALVSQKEAKVGKGSYAGYGVNIACDAQNNIIFEALTTELLAGRYNMVLPETFLNVPTEESLVLALVHLLNTRSPKGYHEHALLREVFPTQNVPEPPAAPAGTSTAPTGFGGFPAAPATAPAAAPAAAPVSAVPGWVA